MGSSLLYEQTTTLPSSSSTMMNDRHRHHHNSNHNHEQQHEISLSPSPSTLSPSSGNGRARRKKSHSNKNKQTRSSKTKSKSKSNKDDDISAIDSLANFFAESLDEDSVFINGGNTGNDKKGDDENDEYDDDDDDDDGVTVQSALMRAGKSSSSKRSKSKSKSKSKSRSKSKPDSDDGSRSRKSRTTGGERSSRRKTKTERDERRQEQRTSRTGKEKNKNKKKDRNKIIIDNSDSTITDDEINNDSAGSFTIDMGDDESEITISSSDDDSQKQSYRTKQRELRATHRLPPPRTQSLHRGQSSLKPRSRAPPPRAKSFSAGNEKNNTNTSKGYQNILTVGLQDLDRQVRRDRMKRGYRGQSVDRRNSNSRQQDNGGGNADGGESVTSGTSFRSTYSNRSYKQSGLEGGAFSAFIGNDNNHKARNTSRGRAGGIATSPLGMRGSGSVMSSPAADEKYMKERKENQDLIMDVALKEKWRHEEESSKEVERVEREKFASTDYYSSDEEFGTKKKKGLVKKMKRAARKTAKLSKSGAKGAANVVKDPKRAAMKAGKVASHVGKETTKMVMDPKLAAKRGRKGVKGTVKLTANVAKGGFDVTSYLTRKGIKGTTKVVGGTINGAGRVVYGATDLIFNHDGNDEVEEVLEDYDPRALSDRQRFTETFADRLSIHDDNNNNNSISNGKSTERLGSRTSKMMMPVMDLSGTSGSKPKKGWWDI